MSRKKIRKTRKGNFFSAIGNFFWGIGWVLWKALPWVILAGLVVLAGFQVKKALCEDRFLKVQEIKVVPPDALSPKSIRALEEKILGKNILLLDLKRIANQIELGPGAQSVRVIREMPSVLRIAIQKRKPIANVQFRTGGVWAIVSEDGYVIDIQRESDPAWILMEDHGEPVKEPRIGMRLQNRGFFETLRFLSIYRFHDLARTEKVTRVILDPYGGVTLCLGEGPNFQLGRKPSEKLSMLVKALYLFKTEPRENFEYIDLQYDRVVVKRK